MGALAGHLVLVWFGAGLRPAPSVVVWALRAHQALPFGVYLHHVYSGCHGRTSVWSDVVMLAVWLSVVEARGGPLGPWAPFFI